MQFPRTPSMVSSRQGLGFIQRPLQRMRWRMRSLLGTHPLYLVPMRHRHPEKTVQPDTTLVIEGFPRSGNTFAETAFRIAQPKPVKMAHHLHIPAQVIAGLKYHIPVLLLIRSPDDAVPSFVIKTGGTLTLRMALQYYIRFYAALLPFRSQIMTAAFEDVVSDFGAVIQQLNAHYGTRFTPFDHTEANVKACFAQIDQRFRGRDGAVSAGSVGRPVPWRQPIKADLHRALHASSLQPLRRQAKRLHVAYCGVSA